MNSYYKILQDTSKENLKKHNITCFDDVIMKYPEHYDKIISYINECYNYKSDFLIEEKDWYIFLSERFLANRLPEAFKDDIVNLKSPEIAIAIDGFVTLQEQHTFQTLVAKKSLRQQMITVMVSSGTANEKKDANKLVSELDDEINMIQEGMRQEQKVFGQFKGIDAVKKAKSVYLLNIANIEG